MGTDDDRRGCGGAASGMVHCPEMEQLGIQVIAVGATLFTAIIAAAGLLALQIRSNSKATNRRIDRSERRNEKQFAEIRELFAERDRRTDKQFAERDRRTDKQFAEIKELIVASDRRKDRQFKETHQRIDRHQGRMRENVQALTDKIAGLVKEVSTMAGRLNEVAEVVRIAVRAAFGVVEIQDAEEIQDMAVAQQALPPDPSPEPE